MFGLNYPLFFLFCVITRTAGARGQPPGERGEGTRKSGKNAEFPPPFPPTVSLFRSPALTLASTRPRPLSPLLFRIFLGFGFSCFSHSTGYLKRALAIENTKISIGRTAPPILATAVFWYCLFQNVYLLPIVRVTTKPMPHSHSEILHSSLYIINYFLQPFVDREFHSDFLRLSEAVQNLFRVIVRFVRL